MDSFLKNSLACSKATTISYSTSFSMGIHLLARDLRPGIYAIYGFVRFADEIVDTFPQSDRKSLLEEFRQGVYSAIDRKISMNPVLNAFQWAVNEYNIDRELVDAFLLSMEMDLSVKKHNEQSFNTYIYGSAEVVGLMCLKVFANANGRSFEALTTYARKLGKALQKVNFLRDIRSDFIDRGRMYFPEADFDNFSKEEKQAIEEDIEKDFKEAYAGIKQLPKKAKLGVYTAYLYYMCLFRKIKRIPAKEILSQRIRVSNARKIMLLLLAFFRVKAGLV